jgi:hypothetical protein
MKKVFLPLLVLVLVVGVATVVWATVIGTPHDLAPEPCAMCHTPHSGTGDFPLWNRTQSRPQTYTTYSSISFDMGPVDTSGTNASKWGIRTPSALCLVCHNGIASEAVNYPGPCSNPDSAYDIEVAGCADLGLDLSNDHPISFNYNSSADLDNNNFPLASLVRSSPSPRWAIKGAITATNYMLYNGDGVGMSFECATCHSVHDLASYAGKGSYQVYFLRNDNTGSTMCLDCHTAR